jgi:hypothetical protein
MAGYPLWLGGIVALVLVVPALVSVLMELTLLGAKRRRDDVMRLVELVTGQATRPRTGSVPGVVAFVFTILAILPAGWLVAGPPVHHLSAPMLYGSCLPVVEGLDVPLLEGDAAEVSEGLVVVVSGDRILVDYLAVPGLDELAMLLGERRQMAKALCERDPSSAGCGAPLLVAFSADVGLGRAADVLAVASGAWGGDLHLVVRTEEGSAGPPGFGEMISATKGLTGMRCVETCPFGLVKVKDVIEGSGSGKAFLDGAAEGTVGRFVEGLDQAAIVVGGTAP